MKLYYVPRTRASRPRWVLEELGVPYELVRLDPSRGETRTPEHLARQPLGHVPALEDGDVRMFESAAICLWLAERFPEKGLLPPPGTAGRAAAYQWLAYALSELEPPLNAVAGEKRKPEAERRPERIEKAVERFRKAAAPLEPILGKKRWLLGDDFTVADVIVAACLSWGRSVGGLDRLPACEAYVSRARERPAFRRATAD